jgi:hypothetical protein
MIIRINAMGKVTLVSGAPLTQGSSLSNEIFFEAPISGAASCNVYFTLPNGAHIGPYYANSCDADASLGINTWHLVIDAAITQYAGELCIHADFMQGKQVLATTDCYTTIRRGAYRPSLVLHENSEQYLEAISKAFADGANALLNVESALGISSARMLYAWKNERSGSIAYTDLRVPSVGDTLYFYNENGTLSSTSKVTVTKSGNSVNTDFIYSEEDNLVEVEKLTTAPSNSVLGRINELNVNAVRFTDLADVGKPGTVKGYSGSEVEIKGGAVHLVPADAKNIDYYRKREDIFSTSSPFGRPLTLGNYKYAMRRATVDAAKTIETPLSAYKEYYLGLRTGLSIAFPSSASLGDRAYIQWVSGQTPTTLEIDESNTSKIEFEPLPEHVCEIQGVYGIVGYDYESNTTVYGWNLVARQSPLEVS